MTEHQEKMKEALVSFRAAYFKLLGACLDAPEIPVEDLYPFHRSFDELGVSEWVDQIITNMLVAEGTKVDIRKQRLFAEYQLFYQDKEDKIVVSFESLDTGQIIVNPWYTECARGEVDPETYYGIAYLHSDWYCKQFDLTREQMIEFLIDLTSHEIFFEENYKNLARHGLRGLDSYSDTELRTELYAKFEL